MGDNIIYLPVLGVRVGFLRRDATNHMTQCLT